MTERDSGRPRLNEKYEAIRRAARDARQVVLKDKEDRGGQDSGTVIRAWEAKQYGEWRTEDAIELLIDLLYADGEVHEELVNKLLVLAKNTPLGYIDDRRIYAALLYAVDRGRYKELRRMYSKRRRHLDSDAGGRLNS